MQLRIYLNSHTRAVTIAGAVCFGDYTGGTQYSGVEPRDDEPHRRCPSGYDGMCKGDGDGESRTTAASSALGEVCGERPHPTVSATWTAVLHAVLASQPANRR